MQNDMGTLSRTLHVEQRPSKDECTLKPRAYHAAKWWQGERNCGNVRGDLGHKWGLKSTCHLWLDIPMSDATGLNMPQSKVF